MISENHFNYNKKLFEIKLIILFILSLILQIHKFLKKIIYIMYGNEVIRCSSLS